MHDFIVVTWPDIQFLMDIDGFEQNSHLVNDENLIDEFESSAYFVRKSWLDMVENSYRLQLIDIELEAERWANENVIPLDHSNMDDTIKNLSDAFEAGADYVAKLLFLKIV